MLRVVVETVILNIPIVLRIHPCPSRRFITLYLSLWETCCTTLAVRWRMS